MKTKKLDTIVWDGDDGPEAYKFLCEKIEKAYSCGGRVIRLGGWGQSKEITSPNQASGGRFIFFIE